MANITDIASKMIEDGRFEYGAASMQTAHLVPEKILPPEAATKLDFFQRQVRDAQGLWDIEREKVFDDLVIRVQKSERRIADLIGQYGLKDNDATLVRERALHADLVDQKNNSAQAMNSYSARANEARAVVDGVNVLLRDMSGRRRRIVMAPPANDGLKVAAGHQDALIRVRGEIEKIKGQIDTARAAALPIADLKRRARDCIAAFAGQGRVRIDDRGVMGWPPLDGEIKLIEGMVPVAHAITHKWALASSVAAITSWLHGDALVARIESDLDARAGDGVLRLTDEERDARLAKLAADLLGRERVEEAIIVAAQKAGQHIARRRDADPRAILGVEDGGPLPEVKGAPWPVYQVPVGTRMP